VSNRRAFEVMHTDLSRPFGLVLLPRARVEVAALVRPRAEHRGPRQRHQKCGAADALFIRRTRQIDRDGAPGPDW
jgi:hypothetical protein